MKLVPIFTTLTLTTLALAGCGTKDDDTTSTSASSASTSASSASASVSNASSDTTAPAIPSVTAQSSEGSKPAASALATTSKSLASKEYQPATEQGPAQNVPRPQQPEGMDIESVEGLEKFLNYWFAMRDYAAKTGETANLYSMVETTAENEQNFLRATDSLYGSKGWVVYQDGEPQLTLDTTSIETNGAGLYSVKANFFTPKSTAYNADGTIAEELDTAEANEATSTIIARFDSGKWSLVNIESSE